jgi:hypothetical protein
LYFIHFKKLITCCRIFFESFRNYFLDPSPEYLFLSYEKEYDFMQGQVVAGNEHTNRLTISDYSQTTDKKGNVKLTMQLRGSLINAKS